MTENSSCIVDIEGRLARPLALALLDEGHVAWLERLAMRHAGYGDVVEVEELVSIGFLALRRAAERYDGGRGVPFRAFAYPRVEGAMVREIGRRLEWARRHRLRERVDPVEGEPRYAEEPALCCEADRSPETLVRDRQRRRALKAALEQLDEPLSDVLVGNYALGCPLTQVARGLGVSYATARRRRSQALHALRWALVDH